MLINTVGMLLRELLPVVVLLSLLLAVLPAGQGRWLLLRTAALAVPGLILQNALLDVLAAAFDGQGLELWYVGCYLCCALLLALLLWRPGTALWLGASLWLGAGAVTALLLVNGHHLVLYLLVYQRHADASQILWLGAALGLGISLSIAVLMYHAVVELTGYWRGLVTLLLCFSAARQLSMATFMLHQLDLLPGSEALWHSQAWLAEDSELGYFLHALLGYEANPSLLQLLVWALSLVLLLVLGRRELRA